MAGLIDLARSLAVGTSPMAAASQERLLDQADGVRSRLEEARSHIVGLLEDAAKANLGTADDEWLELQTARHLLDITLAGPAGGGPSARPRRGRPSTDAP